MWLTKKILLIFLINNSAKTFSNNQRSRVMEFDNKMFSQ